MEDEDAVADCEVMVAQIRETEGTIALRALHGMHMSKNDEFNLNTLLSRCPSSHVDMFCAAVCEKLPALPAAAASLDDIDRDSFSLAANFCAIAIRNRVDEGGAPEPGGATLELATRLYNVLPIAQRALASNILRALEPTLTNAAHGPQFSAIALPTLLRLSTGDKPRAVDIERVYKLRRLFATLDLRKDSANDELRTLLLKACSEPAFLRNSSGQKFIAFLMTLPTIRTGVFDTILNQLAHVRRSLGVNYGQVFLLAWRSKGADRFRATLINIVEKAISAGSEPLASNLRSVLTVFHANKTISHMDALLNRVYTPTLLPNILVANPYVRRNTALILCDAYPIHDPSSSRQSVENAVHNQVDKMIALLEDPVPFVRVAAIHGVAALLQRLYVIVPQLKARKMVDLFTSSLAVDASDAGVRVAAMVGLQRMIENHEMHPLLASTLPRLRAVIHDNSERVRIEMLNLLIKLRQSTILPFAKVVPVEELLYRLEDDSPTVISLVMQLVVQSYFPLEKKGMSASSAMRAQLIGCRALLKASPDAAKTFYQHLYLYASPRDLVEFAMNVSSEAVTEAENPIASIEEEAQKENKAKPSKRNKSVQQKKRARKGDSVNPILLLAVAADIFQSLSPALMKESNKKLRKYVDKVYDAESLEPYCISKKYSRELRAEAWRLSSLLRPAKAKTLYDSLQREIRRYGEVRGTSPLGPGSNRVLAVEYLAALFQCALSWNKLDLVANTVDEWKETIENPNPSETSKLTKKAKKAKKAAFITDARAVNAALKAVITLVNAITFDDVLRTRYLRELRENVEVGKDDVVDENEQHAVLLLQSVRWACKAGVKRVFDMLSNALDKENGGDGDSEQVMKEMCVLAALIVSACGRLLAICMEVDSDIVSDNVEDFLDWACDDGIYDVETQSDAQRTFLSAYSSALLVQCSDMVKLGTLRDGAMMTMESVVQKVCKAMWGQVSSNTRSVVYESLEMTRTMKDHVVYAEEVAKRNEELALRAALLSGVMKNVGQAAFSLLKSMPTSAETVLIEETDMVNALNDVCEMLAKDGGGLLIEATGEDDSALLVLLRKTEHGRTSVTEATITEKT